MTTTILAILGAATLAGWITKVIVYLDEGGARKRKELIQPGKSGTIICATTVLEVAATGATCPECVNGFSGKMLL